MPHDLDVDNARPQTPPPTVVDCAALIHAGTVKHDARDYDGALAVYRSTPPACDRGHGLHLEIGYTLAAQSKIDEAAVEYIIELRGPNPPETTFGNLLAILERLSAARRAEIAGIGSTEAAPLHVPDIGFEYSWVERFACVDGAGRAKGQALINAAGRQLDALAYSCPDGSEHTAYFDFSRDPATQELQKELKQQAPGP